MSNYDEFVELLHCIFLVHPQKVAQEFEPHVDILQDIVESISLEPGETPAFDPSPEDDEDSIADYVEFLMGAFATDPGDVMRAFWGHEAFLNGVIGVIEGGEAPTATRVTADDLADDMDVVQLVDVLRNDSVSAVRKAQAATLLQSNLWIDAANPMRLRDAKGVTALLGVMQRHNDEDDLVAKCCRIMQALFSYKGTMPQADAATRQIIKGKYLIAMGKTWDPSSFNCGKTGRPITDRFYVIDYVPYLPESLSAEQKEGLTLHNVTTVEPSEAQDPGAGLPYINELMEDGGFEAFVDALAQNVTRANDDYVAQAGAKVVQAMVDVDGSFVDRLLQRLRDCTTPGTIAVVCCCCLLKATFTDALLRPNKDYLMSVLQQDQVSSLDVCQQKAAAVLQRLQTV